MVVLPDPESPVNHKVNPRPNLVSFSMLFFFTSCLVYSLSFSACKPSMRTSTTSERLNSGGGYSPLKSISRTFVPERKTCEEGSCGQVLDEPMPPHSVQKNACSKKRGVIPSSSGSNSSKMCWAS